MKESEVLQSLNEYRKSHGLHEYVWNDICAKKAFEHTSNMANKVVPFSHNGWNDRYNSISIQIPGIKSGSENVAYSRPDMNPVEAWKKSSGHNKNMLSDSNLCGIAYVCKGTDHYYTAIFMKKV